MLYIKGFAVVPRGEGDLELLEIVFMSGTRGREVTNGARYVMPDCRCRTSTRRSRPTRCGRSSPAPAAPRAAAR
jgi:hypothetical protein